MPPLPVSSAAHRKPKRIQFGILSPQEIKAMSVCEIYTLQNIENGVPVEGGLSDPRMGPMDRALRCATCQGTQRDCPGHFGHIELAKPVVHVGLINRLVTVLRCICKTCSKLLVSANDPDVINIINTTRDSPKRRLRLIAKLCSSKKRCGTKIEENPDDIFDGDQLPKSGGCDSLQPTVRRNQEDGHTLEILAYPRADEEDADTDPVVMDTSRIYELLRNVSDEDALLLGMSPEQSRPEWLMITCLAVPPLAVRPSVEMGTGNGRSHDDLTFALTDILKANNALKENEAAGSPPHVIREALDYLQYKIATLFDNNLPHMPQAQQRSGKPIKAITERLKGKAGRVRGNLMGKRVDFSARSVITPDPNLAIDQVGVPRSVALTLTVPVRVTNFNIRELKTYVDNGPTEHPGATKIETDDGNAFDLRFADGDINLQPGYIVHRHLKDDDVIIFNRQPTLHKMSMMGHRVKVLPWSTFRMNLSVTAPYNADFDGDEMNMHVPQSMGTRAEIEQLMMCHLNIMTPQSNRPVMGIIQDTLTAVRRMTFRDCFLERHDIMQLLMWLPGWNGRVPIPAIVKPKELWTGKQLFSLIIPERVNVKSKYEGMVKDLNEKRDPTPTELANDPAKVASLARVDPNLTYDDGKILILNGHLVYGILCKKSMGAKANGIIHTITMEHGNELARQFYGNVQTVVNNWLLIHGHSIGIGDAIADQGTYDRIDEHKLKSEEDVTELIRKASEGAIKRSPGCTIRQTFEQKVNKALNETITKTGAEAQNSLSKHNNFKAMALAGSKGSKINISQIIAGGSQQNVEGKRIPFGFKYRSLPHFVKDDFSPQSKGFVFNSYFTGLTPEEFFFHAMGGREGLIDTAVKTAETGYIQRRLVKSMEGLRLEYDGTIRNSNGDLIQLCYGEDGMDGAFVENQTLDFRLSNEKFEAKYSTDYSDKDSLRRFLREDIVEDLAADPDAPSRFLDEFEQLEDDRRFLRLVHPDGESSVHLPINLTRLIWNARKQFHIDMYSKSDLHPIKAMDMLTDRLKNLIVIPGTDPLSIKAQDNATKHTFTHLRSTFSSNRLIKEHRLTEEAFDWILGEIEDRFLEAQANPGEMVGALAAQSLGEPATQMTLNTFHLAGYSAKNVTLGVPRLKEIINVSRNLKTPSMLIRLEEGYREESSQCMVVFAEIEYLPLRSIVQHSSVIYDPDDANSVIPEDRAMLAEYFLNDSDHDPNMFLPWVLRFEFVPREMNARQIRLDMLEETIKSLCGKDNVMCKYNTAVGTSAKHFVFRLRIVRDESDMNGDSSLVMSPDEILRELERKLLDTVSLRGLKDIPNCYISQPQKQEGKQRSFFDADGQYREVSDWIIETDGIDILGVAAKKGVDRNNTTCNSIVDTLEVLGIEAARKSVEHEMFQVISFGGSYVNYRHLSLLCDIMTSRGSFMAITRHGVNRQDTGALMRASFEETVDILLEAAYHGEVDYLRGVSENIMLGNLAPIGTGTFDLLVNRQMLANAIVVSHSVGADLTADDDHIRDTSSGFSGDLTPTQQPATPRYLDSPSPYTGGMTPIQGGMTPNSGAFSPDTYGAMSPGYSPRSPVASPYGNANTPDYSATPQYGPSSPSYTTPQTPGFTPASPHGFTPTSPVAHSPASPVFSPRSPGYSPASPMGQSPSSPMYSPTSPTSGRSSSKSARSPSSPGYSPSSPSYSPSSPNYSPSSPSYSPSSPNYSPSSPKYSPSSPNYSPSSPNYSPSSPKYSPSSPNYSPSSPSYSPSSPQHSPTNQSPASPSYSPTSPQYSPSSPQYGNAPQATSPVYSPSSPQYQANSPPANVQSPASPQYSPTSPQYE